MTIIITEDGRNAKKIEQTPFGLEDKLQEYIYQNPESIPLYDVKEDVKLLILAREFNTASGPIDAIGIDRDGEIYLVETKLYKNPDKRTVVAQVLDYGASLWKSQTDFNSFIFALNSSVQKTFNTSVHERIQQYFNIDDAHLSTLLEHMKQNLMEGNLKFVVLMDNLHSQLKDLILYINQNSKFDIYGVELEYYKHESYEIIIPKLFGAEVKKDVSSRSTDTTYLTNDEFIMLAKKIGLENKMLEVLDLVSKMQAETISLPNWTARRTPKYINFSFELPGSKTAINMSIGLVRGKLNPVFDIWVNDKQVEDITVTSIKEELNIPVEKLLPERNYGIVAKWNLKDFSEEKLIALFRKLSL